MKLMVLDGNSILNRAFYGIHSLTAADGLPTNAVYGFLTILRKLLAEDCPDGICVAFDLRGPTFRHRMYDGYKATRTGMPEELAVQLPWLQQVLDALRIPRFACEGWEADDLLGTISASAAAAGWDCLLVTGDRDSLQLIDERTHVKLVSSRTGGSESREYDSAAFQEEYGFPPARLIDLKALMGDSSDNIPGVKGVGSKTASELLKRFGTLDGVYAALEDPAIRPAVRTKLAAGREQAMLSYTLATIRRDAPLEAFTPEATLRRAPDAELLRTLFQRLGFLKLLDSFSFAASDAPQAPAEPEAPAENWMASDPETVLAACRASSEVLFRCDEEITSLAVLTERGAYLLQQPGRDFLCAFFSADIPKVGSSLKALMRTLLREGIPFGGFTFDAALAAYVLDPSAGSYSLARCAAGMLHRDLPEDTLLTAESLSPLSGTAEARELLLLQAEVLRELKAHMLPLLEEQGMLPLYRDMELPLCRVLAEMEHSGFLVDRGALVALSGTLGAAIDTLQQEIYALAGESFNINSPKQLGEILFERLALPSFGKTRTGYSTNIEVLEKLLGRHPIIEKIIDYRKLSKLKSTYADGLVRFIAPDGRIHTSFQMTATATGRLSSTEPNLQNIPVRTELGGEIRKMFVAAPGCVLVDADYSQIELRILAHLAEDAAMREAFHANADIHRATASQVFGVPPEAVTSLMRSRAKAVNFGIVYGISDYSLSQDLHITRAEAKEYISSYLEYYSGVRRYMQESVSHAQERGYAETLFGRRRYLPELKAANRNTRAFGERVAMNMPVQGTAADVIKLAMLRVAHRLREELPGSRLLLQIHDELIAECPEAQAEAAKRILEEEMSAAAALSVPLTVEAHCGVNWYDAK